MTVSAMCATGSIHSPYPIRNDASDQGVARISRRFIFLDADMLVLDDVSQLWTIPLGGCALAAEAGISPAIVHFVGRRKPWRLTASAITGSRFRLPQVRFHSPGSPGHETC